MTKRLITLMAALLVLGFVVAGCGDDDSSSDGSGDTAAQTVTETVTEDTNADNGGAEVPENLEQAVQQCRDNIEKAPLSDDTKDSLQGICDKAGSGNAEDIKDAAAEVCKKIAGDSIPEGTPGREQALAACDKAGQ